MCKKVKSQIMCSKISGGLMPSLQHQKRSGDKLKNQIKYCQKSWFTWKIKPNQESIIALSFYRSKMILDHPDCFGRLQIVLVGSKPFWSGPNHFGQVQIKLLWTNFYNIDLTKLIWTRPKRIGPILNNWYSTKMIWTD